MKREEAIEIIRKNMPSDKSLPVYEALHSLIPELTESEDERNWKIVMEYVKDDALRAWLEKQKGLDKMIVVSPEVWDNAITDAYENGKRDSEKQKEQKPASYSPLCNTIKDKIREYVANNFVTDTVVKTDVKSIVKAMEEGVRLGKEEQKPAWSEEDERMLNLTKTQLRILQSHLSHTHSERMSDMEYSSQLLQIEKCVSWLDIRFKSLRPQPMNTIKIDELEDFIDTELHKDEFIRRWPQYAFNVPEHKEGDEYSVGVAVGVGRIINKLRNFIVNKKA